MASALDGNNPGLLGLRPLDSPCTVNLEMLRGMCPNRAPIRGAIYLIEIRLGATVDVL
jgi:hypothetical protein